MIKGLILAGGKSTRMGRDKSLIDYHGKPQREFLFDLLLNFCAEVYVSCKENAEVPEKLNPLPDLFDMDSPLNGILSAFTMDRSVAWLTVAVDMPLVDRQTLDYLVLNRDAQKVATCFRDSDGSKPEPLLSLWEPKAFPLLQSFYAEGNISPRSFLQRRDVHLLSVPNKKILTNVNSIEDLNQLKDSIDNDSASKQVDK
ncbi:MAG TPA: molybdenum cofactor guanylyltransferase [Cyclobacteriaceae bacterium]|nr:molybdenum cofactor guanylyltransferase [Cyclobacteriaceae bacterium]